MLALRNLCLHRDIYQQIHTNLPILVFEFYRRPFKIFQIYPKLHTVCMTRKCELNVARMVFYYFIKMCRIVAH